MPTSSQALILHSQPVVKSESVVKSQSLLIKEPASYAVASIYNLSGCAPLSKTTVDDGNAVKLLGTESAPLFKYHKLPDGYTSILAFDAARNTFNWHILGGGADAKTIDTTQAIENKLHNEGSKTGYETCVSRPVSAMDICKQDRARHQKVVNEMMYEKLVVLGFRRSDLTIIGGDGKKIPGGRDVRIPAISMKRSDTARMESRITPNETTTKTTTQRPAVNTKKEVQIKETPSICDVSSDDLEFEYIDEYNRIKPSIHMVKYTPKSRPTAAILSLRENECSFHAEVKFFIETQIGVRVKSIQYDPLHIRSGKPDIRSRWIVDFNTVDDCETVVKKGLIIGKDQIIIYKFDEIMRREVSSFKYFKAVLEAKKKLRGSKSLRGLKTNASAGISEIPLKTNQSVQW